MMTSSMEFPGSLNKWYISGIYCQLGDYISPATYEGNQKQLLTSAMTVKEVDPKNLDFVYKHGHVSSRISRFVNRIFLGEKQHVIFHFKPGTFS